MSSFTPYTTSFATDILPDAPIIGKGLLGQFGAFGVTRGGMKIEIPKKYRNPEFDLKRADIAYLDRIEDHDVVITTTLLQAGPSNINLIEPGLSSSQYATGVILYTPQPGSVFLAAGAYIPNVRVVFRKTDNSYFEYLLPVALFEKYDIDAKDKNEGGIPVTIKGRLDLSTVGLALGNTPDTAPYFIRTLAAGTTL